MTSSAPASARSARGVLSQRRISAAEALARDQGGVISRPQLLELGATRGQIRAQVSARRWRTLRSQCLVVHTGELGVAGAAWGAVLEAGPRAVLDGAAALVAGGLKGFDVDDVRISVPRNARRRRGLGMDVHQTRRYRPDDHAASGVPRTRPAVAAIYGALWARSDKQAVLLMTMAVQQGLTTAERLGTVALRIRRDRRRALIHRTILDLLDGVRSLGEHEFAQACRARGIPEPSRQSLRQGRDGTYYLDVCWDEWGLVVEIDGIQHGWVQNAIGDALRHNHVAMGQALVLRLPMLGLRLAADEFFDQIADALRSRGCQHLEHLSA